MLGIALGGLKIDRERVVDLGDSILVKADVHNHALDLDYMSYAAPVLLLTLLPGSGRSLLPVLALAAGTVPCLLLRGLLLFRGSGRGLLFSRNAELFSSLTHVKSSPSPSSRGLPWPPLSRRSPG